jgi:hypothetical protein
MSIKPVLLTGGSQSFFVRFCRVSPPLPLCYAPPAAGDAGRSRSSSHCRVAYRTRLRRLTNPLHRIAARLRFWMNSKGHGWAAGP